MKKIASIALSAAMFATPVLAGAEAASTFDSAFAAIGGSAYRAAELTVSVNPVLLSLAGVSSDNVQAVNDILSAASVYFSFGERKVHLELDCGDTAFVTADAEGADDGVFCETNLLDDVYTISKADLTKVIEESQSETDPDLGISKADSKQLGNALMALPYNFDSTVACAMEMLGTAAASEENGNSTVSISLTSEQAGTLLHTAAQDFAATPGLIEVLEPYADGITQDSLLERLNSAADKVVGKMGSGTLDLAVTTNADGSIAVKASVALATGDSYALDFTMNAGSATAVISKNSETVFTVTGTGEIAEDNASLQLNLSAGGSEVTLNFTAAAEEDVLGLYAGIGLGETDFASMNLTVSACGAEDVPGVTDKSSPVDIMSLTEDDQDNLLQSAIGSLVGIIMQNADALPQSVRTMLGL